MRERSAPTVPRNVWSKNTSNSHTTWGTMTTWRTMTTARDRKVADAGPVDVSIIIVWNSRDLLGPCLDSLRAMDPPRTCQVILVDNASRDDTVAFVRERYPE